MKDFPKIKDIPDEQVTISTSDLLDKQVDVNKAAAKRGGFFAAMTTVILFGGALLLKDNTNAAALAMSAYGAAMFPQVNFIIVNLRNIRAARKRKQALLDGTYEEKYHETEADLRKFMLENLRPIIEKEQEQQEQQDTENYGRGLR